MLIRVNYANKLLTNSPQSWRDANKAKNALRVYMKTYQYKNLEPKRKSRFTFWQLD